MDETTDLKPCPFCGNTRPQYCTDDNLEDATCVTCDCGASGPAAYRDEVHEDVPESLLRECIRALAEARWDTRHDDPGDEER